MHVFYYKVYTVITINAMKCIIDSCVYMSYSMKTAAKLKLFHLNHNSLFAMVKNTLI